MMTSQSAPGTGASFPRRVWALIYPYWRSDQRRIASVLLITIIAMALGMVYLNVLLNDWSRQFYNALEQRDLDSFKYLLLYFSGLATIHVVVAVYRIYLTQMLE